MLQQRFSAIDQATVHFARIKESLRAKHPEWPAGDTRTALFGKCTTTLGCAGIYRRLFESGVVRRDFWPPYLSESHIEYRILDADTLLVVGTLQACFSAIESSLRLILRAIDPEACSGGLAEFKNVYSTLLARTGFSLYEPHLDLLRLIRNMQHNNGVFLTRRGG